MNFSVSPITLTEEWPRLTRLIILSFLSTLGCSGNILIISSCVVDKQLRHAGNSLIVSATVADLIVSSINFPLSAILLLSGIHVPDNLCLLYWTLICNNFIVCILSSMFISVENFWRLCKMPPNTIPNKNNIKETGVTGLAATPCRALSLISSIWTVALVITYLQSRKTVGLDYCERSGPGILTIQYMISFVIVILPIIITIYFYTKTLLIVKKLMKKNDFKRSLYFSANVYLMKSNAFNFAVFIIFWFPFSYILLTGSMKTVSKKAFYCWAWFGLLKSILIPFFYYLTNEAFRESFLTLIQYCCCKTTRSMTKRQRAEWRMRQGSRYIHYNSKIFDNNCKITAT